MIERIQTNWTKIFICTLIIFAFFVLNIFSLIVLLVECCCDDCCRTKCSNCCCHCCVICCGGSGKSKKSDKSSKIDKKLSSTDVNNDNIPESKSKISV